MNMTGVFMGLLMGLTTLHASDQSYRDGKRIAERLKATKLGDVSVMPHYEGASVPEASYSADELEKKARDQLQRETKNASQTGEVSSGSILSSSFYDKEDVVLTEDDPLFQISDDIANNPLKELEAARQKDRLETVVSETTETCREPSRGFELEATSYLTKVMITQKRRDFRALEERRYAKTGHVFNSPDGWQGIGREFSKTGRSKTVKELETFYRQEGLPQHQELYEHLRSKGVHYAPRSYEVMSEMTRSFSLDRIYQILRSKQKINRLFRFELLMKFAAALDVPYQSGDQNADLLSKVFGGIPTYDQLEALFEEGLEILPDVWQVVPLLSEGNLILFDRFYHHRLAYDYFERTLKHPVRSLFESIESDVPWEYSTRESYQRGSEDLGEEYDVWEGDKTLEALVDQGLCEYGESYCVEGKATRVIGGVRVTRPCWAKRQTYVCRYQAPDTCTALRKKGCQQQRSRCLKKLGQRCLYTEKTFRCRTVTKRLVKGGMKGKIPYCLDGNCEKISWEPNGDMAEVLAKLDIFRKIAKDMDPETMTVFNGKDMRCGRHCVNFTSCCRVSGGGWGVSLGLSKCSEEEKALSKHRGKQRCRRIGTYCAEKLLGVCLLKKTSFCCFESRLGRVFHEQARQQLGIPWGKPKTPNCRGLTVQELSQIDFSKLNLSEIHEELLETFAPPTEQSMNRLMINDWKARLPTSGSQEEMKDALKERQAQLIGQGHDATLHHDHESRDMLSGEANEEEVERGTDAKLVF